ncbi:MAG: small ribosomal subunit Rsm22 family protein, partial [Atribacterota bacterium]
MSTLFQELDTVIPHYLFGRRTPAQEEIRRAIVSASSLFTFGEEERPVRYFAQKEVLKGYLLYFLPVSLHKMYFTLKETFRHPALRTTTGSLRILDIGCGITPSIIALLELYKQENLPPIHFEYTGVDVDPHALRVACELMTMLVPSHYQISYQFLKMDLRKAGSFTELKNLHPHLLLMSNSLGELVSQGVPLMDLSKKLGAFILEDHLTAIFIEPGTKNASQRLHFVRDFLIQQYRITPYSPCPHSLPCPALRQKNWCYEEWRWRSPNYLRFLEPVGLQTRHLKLSYAIFTPQNHHLTETF